MDTESDPVTPCVTADTKELTMEEWCELYLLMFGGIDDAVWRPGEQEFLTNMELAFPDEVSVYHHIRTHARRKLLDSR